MTCERQSPRTSEEEDALGATYLAVLRMLARRLEGVDVVWALTGSTSFAVQGVPLRPDDVDVQTSKKGAYVIETQCPGRTLEPVSLSESEQIRSHFGVFAWRGVRVEIMGAMQRHRDDGTWTRPSDVAERRTFVEIQGMSIPVLPLRGEAQAYEQLGRTERADLLREYAERGGAE